MKHMNKILALALALIMILGLATTASAATITNEGAHEYEVYQIFTGDLSEGVLSNVKWGVNGSGYVADAVTAVNDAILTELEGISDKTDVEQLAVINKYVNLNTAPYGTVEAKNKLTNVPNGYYLIKDVDGAVTGNDFYTLYIVEIVDDVTITPKGDTPEVEKKVKDTNDTTGKTTDWQDSADYDIGDAVPFQLTAKLPNNVTDYASAYKIVFHDTMSAGLTFDANSVKVYVDEQLINSDYSVVTEGLDDGCTFEVVIPDVEAVDATNNSVITVEYSATLNENAVIGAAGNPNEVSLEYSNNPNWVPGDHDGDGEEDEEPTGETPKDKVIVFTFKVIVNKVDEDKEPLAGAAFTLYKKNANGEYVALKTIETGDGENENVFSFEGLDDGDYKLEETVTPAGYNTIDPIEFTVTAEHEVLSDNPALTSLTGTAITGKITFTPNITENDASLSTDIINQAGTVLPETGGMGTILFYALGGLLVAAAVVLLVTKKRMSSAQ